ncbi:MAG: hypothetical protein JSS94_02840 [Bacteroidetes bacterium]|nr:hypothetical protein [Bacteroidota bacterium]
MTTSSLYYPFRDLNFDDQTCFLSGEKATELLTIFPEWFMDRFNFRNDSFEMMDKLKSVTYGELTIPCSLPVKKAWEKLDENIQKAFDQGYDAISTMDDHLLFLWLGRMVYGTLFHEMSMEKKRLSKYEKTLQVSPFLKERFGLFHLMLQSIIHPMEFIGEKKPWSITVVKVKFSEDIMNYRDDTVNLMFSLAVNGFGIIASLHDNQVVADHQINILEKIGKQTLHPIQFEELYARFHYSNYLLQYEPEFIIEKQEDKLTIEALPIKENSQRPLFGFWDEDMFASVLAGYWEIYGIEKKKILKFPNPILSYLEDPYTRDFIEPEKIKLPF